MQEPHQFGLFGQKGIVAVRTLHFAVIGMSAGLPNALGKTAHVGGGKQPVGADPDEAEPGADASESGFGRLIAADRSPVSMARKMARIRIGKTKRSMNRFP